MATAAQIKANRENAQKSTGAKTEAGKEASSRNNFRHGLTGHAFFFAEEEDPEEFDSLKEALKLEHQPATASEHILVEKMAQHYWLSQRAQSLQTFEMTRNPFDPALQKNIDHFARYQTTHDRLFQRALHDLLKLRAEKRKAEIGFESHKRVQANETRKAETHKLKSAILETRLEREVIHTNKVKPAATVPSQPEIEPKTVPMAA